ncbi:MAG: 23S rRNA (adenine(2503)-C(2))-methyltransferase RlmN [Chlamydiales bacterium]|nr:23S rRNA (adenine(2503)-C(2))-methyltransferase RlmN [Chlamydiales bacterium]
MKELCSMTLQELTEWVESKEERPFVASQIFDWVYKKQVLTFDEMLNIRKSFRALCKEELAFPVLEKIKTEISDDKETYKTLWRLKDGRLVESVLICSEDRRTVCVSSQVGCPARCAFCASGKEGLIRHLSPAEILEQILHTERDLRQKGEKVSNIVFMGMGEPLDNYDTVVKTIRFLNDPSLMNMSQRRITVSTVGVIEGIYKLAEEDLKVNLVLSLHAPNQKIRQKIIPYARKYALEDVMKAMDHYAEKTKRDLTFEYTLIAGINDQVEHAEELATLVESRQCTVNLIPYNPVLGLRLVRPSFEVVSAFRDALDERGVINTCRYTKGDDIAAACGQLVLRTVT